MSKMVEIWTQIEFLFFLKNITLTVIHKNSKPSLFYFISKMKNEDSSWNNFFSVQNIQDALFAFQFMILKFYSFDTNYPPKNKKWPFRNDAI